MARWKPKTPASGTVVGALGVAFIIANFLSDAGDLDRAVAGWRRRPSVAAALHVLTSGLFLAEDIAALP